MRQVAFFALLLMYAMAYPSTEKMIEKYEDIPPQYRELIPEKVAEHLKAITAEERKILSELVKDYAKYKDEDEFLAALKEKSESLYEKAKTLHDFLKEKVDALGDEAKEFVKKLNATARKFHAELLAGVKPSLEELKTEAKKYLEEFEKLSDQAKEDFKKQFPILTSVLNSEYDNFPMFSLSDLHAFSLSSSQPCPYSISVLFTFHFLLLFSRDSHGFWNKTERLRRN
ncbi:hypothetical protein KIN20_014387 [Parelaphostrongylus tenuis]|uniref:Fatty-acid and retinol-binding protein 1 n=1 Tax=Parelaphostrongylus tenuis TaxID=148309 RepID=A0AAD5QPD6_PARTN|nr:hypothetical protein KIN20_014387 [Parelaphostrongylus tenuis]